MENGYEYKQFTVDLSMGSCESCGQEMAMYDSQCTHCGEMKANEGYVLARVATLNVPDNEDDVLMSGSVGTQNIIVSKWNHSSKKIFGPSPVGMGKVYEDGDSLLAEIEYFINETPPNMEAVDAYNTVKRLSKNSQCYWSIAYKTKETDYKELKEGNVPRVIRYIHKMSVDEASPVDDPGGVGTGTIDIKQARPNLYKQRMYEMRLKTHKKWLELYNNS